VLLSRWVTGALYQFFLVFIFLMLIYWQARRRIPWAPIVALAALFAVLNPVKHSYRTWMDRKEGDSGVLERAETFLSLTLDYYGSARESGLPGELAASSLGRVGHLSLFAYVVQLTPEVVPYWRGQTYKFFAASVVPRFLWPDKPVADYGNEFGHRYGLLYPGNDTTSINLPWVTEFYANFGVAGVALGMTLVGAGFRLLTQKLGNPLTREREYVLGLTLVFQLFYAESNLALMWGGLILTFGALYATLFLVGHRFRW